MVFPCGHRRKSTMCRAKDLPARSATSFRLMPSKRFSRLVGDPLIIYDTVVSYLRALPWYGCPNRVRVIPANGYYGSTRRAEVRTLACLAIVPTLLPRQPDCQTARQCQSM